MAGNLMRRFWTWLKDECTRVVSSGSNRRSTFQKLRVESLEARTLLFADSLLHPHSDASESIDAYGHFGYVAELAVKQPLNLVLISSVLPQAEQIRQAAVENAVTVVYDDASITTQGLVDLLRSISMEHGNAQIGHLAIAAHGFEGSIAIGAHELWNQTTLDSDAAVFEQLRSCWLRRQDWTCTPVTSLPIAKERPSSINWRRKQGL